MYTHRTAVNYKIRKFPGSRSVQFHEFNIRKRRRVSGLFKKPVRMLVFHTFVYCMMQTIRTLLIPKRIFPTLKHMAPFLDVLKLHRTECGNSACSTDVTLC